MGLYIGATILEKCLTLTDKVELMESHAFYPQMEHFSSSTNRTCPRRNPEHVPQEIRTECKSSGDESHNNRNVLNING